MKRLFFALLLAPLTAAADGLTPRDLLPPLGVPAPGQTNQQLLGLWLTQGLAEQATTGGTDTIYIGQPSPLAPFIYGMEADRIHQQAQQDAAWQGATRIMLQDLNRAQYGRRR